MLCQHSTARVASPGVWPRDDSTPTPVGVEGIPRGQAFKRRGGGGGGRGRCIGTDARKPQRECSCLFSLLLQMHLVDPWTTVYLSRTEVKFAPLEVRVVDEQ